MTVCVLRCSRKISKDDSAFDTHYTISAFRFEIIVDCGSEMFAIEYEVIVFFVQMIFPVKELDKIVH